MGDALDQVAAMLPALLFLCVGVPLATLLDRIGYFGAVTSLLQRRAGSVRIVSLWVLACATTALLNLDTTVVLLTPLYIRLALRTGLDPFRLALIPLITASLASSFLPISNLTTLIAANRLDVGVADVVTRLAVPGAVACVAGWVVFRRTAPVRTPASAALPVNQRSLWIGSTVVAGLLIGFVFGPVWHIEPWVVALVAVGILAIVDGSLPWRHVPVLTALGVAALAFVAALIVPGDATEWLADVDGPAGIGGTTLLAAASANVVNNLPALVIGLEGVSEMSPGVWAWLFGVNTGAALLPIGALANLLWWRIAREEGVEVDLRRYVSATAPVLLPALGAATITVAVTSPFWR